MSGTMQCPSCRRELREGARFCEQCGAALSVPDDRDDRAERRLVTILFSDLVDSTALSQRLDPEELRDVIHRYHEACEREIQRFGGYVAQYLGDGVLAFFGYPVARERDAEAAIEAGRGLLAAVEHIGREDLHASIRVGIHSGLVVAGEVGAGKKRERLAIGSAPNVAARVQGAARPGTLVISESTHALAGRFFDCVDLGVQEMKGVEAGMRCYEVRGASETRTRIVSESGATLSPLVGRDSEVERLADAWERARAGRGGVVLVAGEPGLGKSRLLLELRRRLEKTEHECLECSCSPFAAHSAFFPVIDALARRWELPSAETATERSERLRAAIAATVPGAEDALGVLAPLFGATRAADAPELDLAPQRLKQRTLEILASILEAIAADAPLLFAVEDLHWIDPSTRELLDRVVAKLPESRMLALFLFRPEFESPWGDGAHVTRIDLARLGEEKTASLVLATTGGRALPPELVREILERADGVPLYVEEITRMVVESDALVETGDRFELREATGVPKVPVTLQESLMARLDRVASSKDVLQLGATIGRSFPLALLRAVSGLSDEDLDREIDRLVDAGILHREPEGEACIFKHALIHDAAYESMLKTRRREHHLRIAEEFENGFPELAEARPELLLHHWGSAERPELAIPWAVRGGIRAKERSALVEAETLLRRGLALLPSIEDEERARGLELELLLELGPVLVSTLGYSNAEVEAVYARARELVEASGGDLRLRFTVLSGLLLFHQSRAELALCVDLTRQRMEIAGQLGDPDMEMLCHENLGTLALWRGDLELAERELLEALSRYTPAGGRAMRLAYGTDVSVISRSYLANIVMYRGRLDEGRDRALESIEVARALGHVGSLALALNFNAGLFYELCEAEPTLALAEEVYELATREHLALWIGASVVRRVQALTLAGDPDAGIEAFFAGMTAFSATGATISVRYFAASLAEAYLAAGRAKEGLGMLDTVLAGVAHCEDVFYDADHHRVRGSLHRVVTPDDPGLAEGHFRRATHLARSGGNRLLELRAATALAEHLGAQDRRSEARDLLGPVYDSFSEGHGSGPMTRARAVLAGLEA